MSYSNECRILDELVDDASLAKVESVGHPSSKAGECVEQLVGQIAVEMAVPQHSRPEVVEQVVAAIGPQLEETVRRQMRQSLDHQQ